MAVSLKHTTQAVGTDAGNGEIRKAQWNEEHALTAAADTLLGAVTAGAVGEITCTAAGRALLDDTDAAAQRTTLGLGSAATLTAGTSANNLVQLDGSAKLPAVDGSQLTNIPSVWGRSITDTQTFNTSGTWTKPSSGLFALVRCWGGGGSGRKGSSTSSGGGSGGAFHEYFFPLSELPSTVTVTIGSGGTAPTVAGTNGNAGGNTTFGSYVSASGGNGGTTGGISGGGVASLVTNTVAVLGSVINSTAFPLTIGVSSAALISVNPNTNREAGGGGTLPTAGGSTTSSGAGGGGSSSTAATAGGTSTNGGAGGAGSVSGTAVSGSQPGGGGGGTYSGNAGAGGNGRCVVYVF